MVSIARVNCLIKLDNLCKYNIHAIYSLSLYERDSNCTISTDIDTNRI